MAIVKSLLSCRVSSGVIHAHDVAWLVCCNSLVTEYSPGRCRFAGFSGGSSGSLWWFNCSSGNGKVWLSKLVGTSGCTVRLAVCLLERCAISLNSSPIECWFPTDFLIFSSALDVLSRICSIMVVRESNQSWVFSSLALTATPIVFNTSSTWSIREMSHDTSLLLLLHHVESSMAITEFFDSILQVMMGLWLIVTEILYHILKIVELLSVILNRSRINFRISQPLCLLDHSESPSYPSIHSALISHNSITLGENVNLLAMFSSLLHESHLVKQTLSSAVHGVSKDSGLSNSNRVHFLSRLTALLSISWKGVLFEFVRRQQSPREFDIGTVASSLICPSLASMSSQNRMKPLQNIEPGNLANTRLLELARNEYISFAVSHRWEFARKWIQESK